MLQAKNYENRPMRHEAIQKIKVARFLWTTVYIVLLLEYKLEMSW